MRIALTVLLVAHGALHLLGFVKWWPLTGISQLHVPEPAALVNTPLHARAFATYWLLACLLFLAAALLHAQGNRDWYEAALAALVLSQILIVFVWRDAEFGTIANVLVLVPTLLAAANAKFNREFERESRTILASAAGANPAPLVQARELMALPTPVQRWLERAGVLGKPHVRALRLRQIGELRTSPEGPWLPATAEQYFSIPSPAFAWSVDTSMYGLLPIAGRDDYRAGKGRMRIEAASLFSLVDATGPKIDSGAMQRFLGEMVWFPSAALSSFISWSSVDERTAKATFNDQGHSVSAEFEIDTTGRVVSIHALRYLGGGADAVLTPWLVSCAAWARFGGVEIPVAGDVAWQLPHAHFSYYRFRIVDVEYDPRNSCAQRLALDCVPG